jgi:uncharacterized protein (TIGR00251 family)
MKQVDALTDGRLSFAVRLVPRASRSEVIGWSDTGQLRVRITAAPVEEAANRQLVEFLSKILDVRRSDVTIASGLHSRTKRLVVPQECKNRLLSFVDIC